MNNFGTIASNVGIRVGDTSTTFANIVKGYINQRYKDVYQRFNWDTIVPAYTFSTVAGTNEYDAPTDFWKELYVYDTTNSVDLTNRSIQDLEQIYPSNLQDSSSPVSYAIYNYMDTSNPALIKKKIRLFPNPAAVAVISMPYIKAPTDMSATTDLPILECDHAVELGATADAWRTKRQFAKAGDFDGQYERKINTMIWNLANQPNRIVQFRPNTYNKDQLY